MKAFRLIFNLIILCILVVGCTKNNPVAPTQVPTGGHLSFSLDAAANVASGTVTIAKGAITQVLPITITNHSGSVTFTGIQVGTWGITVQLYDAMGVEIYTGMGTGLVAKNQTTSVTIHVNQNTGNLEINVVVPGDTGNTNTAQGLVLWNTMGSEYEITHSAYGPSLKAYDPNDPIVIFTPAMSAYPAYVQGVYGNATTIGGLADYSNPNRSSCTFELENVAQLLNPEHGTIEFWYMQNGDPTFGQNGALYPVVNDDIGIYSYHKPYNFYYLLTFGNPAVVINTDISAYNSTWIHMAAVWNRGGIQGTSDAMRLYINGNLVASNTNNNWGHTITQTKLRIMAGVDTGVVNKWRMDNLKIFNYSKTDFSDRNQE